MQILLYFESDIEMILLYSCLIKWISLTINLTKSKHKKKVLWTCLWVIILTKFTDMEKFTQCGWQHSRKGVLDCINGERDVSSSMNSFLPVFCALFFFPLSVCSGTTANRAAQVEHSLEHLGSVGSRSAGNECGMARASPRILGYSTFRWNNEHNSPMIISKTPDVHTLYLRWTRAIYEPWRVGRVLQVNVKSLPGA